MSKRKKPTRPAPHARATALRTFVVTRGEDTQTIRADAFTVEDDDAAFYISDDLVALVRGAWTSVIERRPDPDDAPPEDEGPDDDASPN